MIKSLTVHPATILEFSRGELNVPRKPRRHTARNKSSEVETTVMNMQVWKTALELAGDNKKRIEVVNEECVIVHNDSDKSQWPALHEPNGK